MINQIELLEKIDSLLKENIKQQEEIVRLTAEIKVLKKG
jgi:hypothetical protein